jgi:hypothetical protein
MSKDSRDEALDGIQDIAIALLVRDDLPADVCEDLEIIEALARHRDLSGFLDSRRNERLAEIRRANETGDSV